jgi:hypothetical protein
MVVASSFRTSGVADLEVIFHENMKDLRTLLALENELRRRKTPSACVLCGRVQQQLVSLQVTAARSEKARPWYRRGVFWLSGFQGSAAQKLAMFEKLRESGAFESVSRRELLKLENMLRTFAAMEKE